MDVYKQSSRNSKAASMHGSEIRLRWLDFLLRGQLNRTIICLGNRSMAEKESPFLDRARAEDHRWHGTNLANLTWIQSLGDVAPGD
jgi:hypothetical protein